jgi:hypothetical protein
VVAIDRIPKNILKPLFSTKVVKLNFGGLRLSCNQLVVVTSKLGSFRTQYPMAPVKTIKKKWGANNAER